MDIKPTCCQDKHFSADPSYVRGRDSLARCCCLFFKSVLGCAYFFLTSPRFSHIYHTGCGEQGLLTQGRGKVRPCNPCSHGGGGNKALEPWLRKYLAVPISTYISFNMCSCLCVQPNCWWILSDYPPTLSRAIWISVSTTDCFTTWHREWHPSLLW